MPLLVTSASGANGNGFGALLAFESDGRLRGTFTDDDRISDPRGLAVDPKENLLFLNSGADRVLAISSDGRVVRDTGRIEGLNPGGGTFGPDGRYYVGLRSKRTIIALSTSLKAGVEHVLPPRVVPFPRGFGFGQDGRLFLASGIGPNGQGDNTIMAFTPTTSTPLQPVRLVADPELSPLDLAIAPNGNIVVSSERPFGAEDAVTTVREYDARDGTSSIPRFPHLQDRIKRLCLRVFLEHLLYRFVNQILVLVAIIAQRPLGDSAPHKLLGFCVIQVYDQRPLCTLLRSDCAHPSKARPCAPGAVGGLLLRTTARYQNQVRVLRFLDLGQPFALHCVFYIRLGNLRQNGVANLVGILFSPRIGVELGEILSLEVVDGNLLRHQGRGNGE